MLNLVRSQIDDGPGVLVVRVQAYCPRCGRKSKRAVTELSNKDRSVRLFCAECRRIADNEESAQF